MKRDRLLQALRDLASLEFQMKYCVNGTKEEYMLPEEMVDDAVVTIETIFYSDNNRTGYNHSELDALSKFFKIAKEKYAILDISNQSMESLILHDENWRVIRQAAHECLAQLEQSSSQT